MPDYNKGKIYTIRCITDDTMIYVGSTIQPLYKRLYQHKVFCIKEKYKHLVVYKAINNDWDNWKIELHLLYPCSCKEELERKEGEIIREIGTLNMNIAGRNKNEWYNDNIDKCKQKTKDWSENNKEKKIENAKIRYVNNKQNYLERAKKNRENNSKKITCECGCNIKKYNLSIHKKTQKHLDLISKVEN